MLEVKKSTRSMSTSSADVIFVLDQMRQCSFDRVRECDLPVGDEHDERRFDTRRHIRQLVI
jgi:hypothetical protein